MQPNALLGELANFFGTLANERVVNPLCWLRPTTRAQIWPLEADLSTFAPFGISRRREAKKEQKAEETGGEAHIGQKEKEKKVACPNYIYKRTNNRAGRKIIIIILHVA